MIRLITRLIFVWFIKEKGLVPEALFRERDVKELLQNLTPDESTYYKAILQNLFFATLNTEMNAAGKPPQRMFRRRTKQKGGRDQHYMVHNVYRYEDSFKNADAALEIFADIPFLNGGLFECLDKRTGTADKPVDIRIDGFSDRDDNPLAVPNFLFFGDERDVDLNEVYGTKSRRYKAQGIINILSRYKFTVNENTPVEEEVALDPELLGRVFENLLASYNPETSTTARKQTGSFYTPREIVNYMVDEALIAYLETALSEPNAGTQPATGKPKNEVLALDAGSGDLALAAREPYPHLMTEGQRDEENTLNARLGHLLAYNDEPHRFTPREVKRLITVIDSATILDPACGSGAFPMGVLHKLVFVLSKLDPRNLQWEARQLERVKALMREAASIPDAAFRERALADLEAQEASIEEAFERNELDYGRKLFLIENCIFGVDIQPIAVQIAKLRFFVSLIVDQKLDDARENRGVRPLPNLETRFVAANTLIGIERPAQAMLRNPDIDEKERELKSVRERYFTARTPATKEKYRNEDGRMRQELAELFKNDGFSPRAAKQLAGWNPYDQNASADFFDLEWMFGMMDGFSITIGNPPYVRADEQSEWNQRQREKILASKQYETLWEKWDLFVPFIERAHKLLKHGGVTTLIVSDAFCHSKYAQKPQHWFLQNARILRLDFCSELQIFDAAVHNLIYFFQRADGTRHTPERRLHHKNFGDVTMLPSDEQAKLTYRAFFPEQSQHTGFSVSTLPIDSICYVSFGCRPNSDEKRAKGLFVVADLLSETRDKNHPKPYIEAKDVVRWAYIQSRWLEWGTKRSPELLTRPTFEELYEVPEKLVAADVSGAENRAAYDSAQVYHSHTLISFVPWHYLHGVRNNSLKKSARYRGERPPRPDLPKREELEETSSRFAVKYVLAVMNSSAARDFLRANRRSNIHLYPDDWKKLPIPDVPPSQQASIVALVDRILIAKRTNPGADVGALETQINHLISQLYGRPPEIAETPESRSAKESHV